MIERTNQRMRRALLSIAAALCLPALPALAQQVTTFDLVTVTDTKTGKDVQLDLTKVNATLQADPNYSKIGVSLPTSTKIGPQGKGMPACGGVINGKPQPPCGLIAGTYESQAVGSCPDGSFFDGITWACWRCPPGFQRSGHPLDGNGACSIADSSMKGDLKAARYAGPLCPPGSFHDPIRGGECYSCPPGYARSTAHIDAPNACFVAAGEKVSFAELSFRTGDARQCVNRADGADRGQLVFWDGHNFNGQGAGCWKCPVGFGRTSHPVYSDRACAAGVAEQQARATVVKKAECAPGEIHDMKIPGKQDAATGGGCYTCPEGTIRTMHDVTGGWACGKDVGVRLAKATRQTALSCPAGQHFDFISSKHPKVQELVRRQFAGKPLPQGFGTSDGGTCWSCPPGSKRSTRAVYEPGACETQLIKWQPAPYGQPGLFGLDGGQEVAQALVRDRRDLIDDLALDLYGAKMGKAEARRMVWDEIASTPHTSGVLSLAVLSRVQMALMEPGKATEAERRLAASFAKAARDFRVFIAQNALDAYDAWKTADTYYRHERTAQTSSMAALYEYGAVPPDFHEVAGGVIIGSTGVGAAMGTAIGIGMRSSAGWAKIMPFAAKETAKFVRQTTKDLTEKLGAKVAEQVARQTAKAISTSIKMLGTLGPQIIITLAIEAIEYTTEQVVAMTEARPKLLTRLATAQQPINLVRLMATPAGISELENMWVLAMGGEIATTNLPFFKQAAAEALKPALAQGWNQLPGAALDVGAGGNALWAIGTSPVPGGFGLLRWEGKTFVPASGGAVRIDVDPQGNPWVVNDKDELFRWTGSAWTMLAAKAKDVGIGANGTVWIIGTNKVPGGFNIQRWNGSAWLGMPGGALRIDVDPQGNPWIVNDTNNIFRWTGSTWQLMAGRARDVGIGPEGSVYVVGDNHVVRRWNGSIWITQHDVVMNEITVGLGGVAVGVNAAKQVWLGYP